MIGARIFLNVMALFGIVAVFEAVAPESVVVILLCVGCLLAFVACTIMNLSDILDQ
jgi:hypothetical protein